MKKIILLFLICSLCFHCGYHLRGTGSSLPPYIKVLNVPMFANLTTRFELDLKLTQEVIDEMVTRGKVEITDKMEDADAILIGEILRFHAMPIGFGQDATADRYSISIVAKVILRDMVQKKVIFSNPSFVYQGEYAVPEGADFESVETEAIDEMAVKFARSLVVAILEGF
jgi:outer membrane lipopolysaccharide assembly protein LptE/RlpB